MSVVDTVVDVMLNGRGERPRLVVTGFSVFTFWFFMAWSLGFVPALGAGFARAEDVHSVQAHLLENAIIEARIRYCTAPNGTPSKVFYLKSVNEKTAEYRDLTEISYPLPTCEELVVASN